MGSVTLQVIDGADRGRTFDELSTPITIGREEGNTIQLNDERVSRFHLKIQEDQDKLVLTDLESTNGTKVNGEDVQLRILRFGDMIAVGRSVLWVGSRRQIADRLATLRGRDPNVSGTIGPGEAVASNKAASLDFELNWKENSDVQAAIYAVDPPDLPARLSPVQAAQLSELLEYIHIRLRELLNSVKVHGRPERLTVEERHWQGLLDLQSRVSAYLRSIGEPGDQDG